MDAELTAAGSKQPKSTAAILIKRAGLAETKEPRAMPGLEDEMGDFGPGGLSSGASQDRPEALVWEVTAREQGGDDRESGLGSAVVPKGIFWG